MPGSNDPSTAARVHVVKGERSDDMQENGKEAPNNSKSKGKGKARAENDVGDDGPPVVVREPSNSRHATDPWDDFQNAWAVEQSNKKGGPSRGRTNQNQNSNRNHPKQQKQQRHDQNQNQNQNHHPNGQRQSGSASSAQNRPPGRGGGGGGDGQVHAGQKRKGTESSTNGITGTGDGGDRGHAPKRHKNERPRPNLDSSGTAARSHPDFWYIDGSVIIQVEQTKFKLHQTTLQKHSAYFAAAFRKKGSQKRGGRTYLEVEIDERSPNGHHLPVYRVTETTADDFATLLTVIEEPMCVVIQ